MEKRTRTILLISITAAIVLIAYSLSQSDGLFFSPPVYESCSASAPIQDALTVTGSSSYTIPGTSNLDCLRSPLYSKALKNSKEQAEENARTLCQNAPPQGVSCADPTCSPIYISEPPCEAQYPILTEIQTSSNSGITTCEIIATIQTEINEEYQCVRLATEEEPTIEEPDQPQAPPAPSAPPADNESNNETVVIPTEPVNETNQTEPPINETVIIPAEPINNTNNETPTNSS